MDRQGDNISEIVTPWQVYSYGTMKYIGNHSALARVFENRVLGNLDDMATQYIAKLLEFEECTVTLGSSVSMNRRQKDAFDPATDYRAKGLKMYNALYWNCLRTLEKYYETEKSLMQVVNKLESKLDADNEVDDVIIEACSLLDKMKGYREAVFYKQFLHAHPWCNYCHRVASDNVW
ncbi:hypothetical protein HDU81_010874 [Chytriomyces hyalinus]|nr:hypothetical protein HDU81_010874 [Chytriomyces hyalinus]